MHTFDLWQTHKIKSFCSHSWKMTLAKYTHAHTQTHTLTPLNVKSPLPKKAYKQNGAGMAAGGTSMYPRGTFKKWNYPCSLVVLSKHPFFFTAPHKGPFDIFLMESAKPTFGSRHPPFPAPHNPVKKHTSWLQTDKLVQ